MAMEEYEIKMEQCLNIDNMAVEEFESKME